MDFAVMDVVESHKIYVAYARCFSRSFPTQFIEKVDNGSACPWAPRRTSMPMSTSPPLKFRLFLRFLWHIG